MPLWRSTPSTSAHPSPSSSTSPLPSTSPPPPPAPPGFLANHHRQCSSTSSLPSHARAPSHPKARPLKRTEGKREADELGADDEPWDEGSDDEATVARLAGRLGAAGLSVKTSGGPVVQVEGPGSAGVGAGGAASPSSWFNPFGSRGTPSAPSRQISASSLTPGGSASPSLAAEAVAAALSGRPSSSASAASSALAPPAAPARGASYLAGASRVQEEADEAVRAEERRRSIERGEEVALPPASAARASEEGGEGEEEGEEEGRKGRERRGSTWQKEQWRKAIRPDVDELVKDPAYVLHRLKTAWAPPPPSSPTTRQGHRASISSVADFSPHPDASFSSSAPGDDDDEEDPAAGYVQLDAPSLSSADPTLFDYSAPPPNPEEEGERGRENRRKRKFLDVLGGEGGDSVDLGELRKLAWNGVPGELRTMVWQLLLGYLPLPSSRRASTLARKRSEYASLVKHAFSRGVKGLEAPIWHQISIDVPRTRPGVLLWGAEATQRSLERVLYVWAIRHPASGYVQGINDLVCPFFEVFLESYITSDPELFDVSVLPPPVLEALEADSFWCLSKLLDGIQTNYTPGQPGILAQVGRMGELCQRVDAPLAAHLSDQGVEFIQFAFRWMNCLLMRELSVRNIVRMWDTYLAEGGDAFSNYHCYVCLSFLTRWSEQLRGLDFQGIILFLQALPTQGWTDKDTELLLSEAFLWSRTFQAR
ncbi:hypothetical protein JCM8097_009051 [Rhodosporidiobolus ruineniae]